MNDYDSRPDTYAHIQTVQRMLNAAVRELLRRADEHDQSKLVDPERAVFDKFTPSSRR